MYEYRFMNNINKDLTELSVLKHTQLFEITPNKKKYILVQMKGENVKHLILNTLSAAVIIKGFKFT